jgi:hypothetical protein
VSAGEPDGAVSAGEPTPAPLLSIVRGQPTDAEVVALTLVLAAAGGGEPPAPRRRERWGDPAELLRRPLHPGPGAWSASLRQQ